MRGMKKNNIIMLMSVIGTLVISLVVIICILATNGLGDIEFDWFNSKDEVKVELKEKVLNEDENNVFRYNIEYRQEEDEKLKTLYPYKDKSNEKYGYMDETGKVVLEAQYDNAEVFSEGMAVITENYIKKYITTNGKIAFQGEFSDAEKFVNGVAVVKGEGKKYYLIDKNGKKIGNEYERIRQRNGIYIGKRGLREYFLNREGVEVKMDSSADIISYSNGIVIASNKSGKYGIIDENGNEIVKAEFRRMGEFKQGTIIAYKDYDSDIMIMDKYGQEVELKSNYVNANNGVYNETENLIFIDNNTSEYVITDRAGNIKFRINKNEFEDIHSIGKFISVSKDNKYGVLNDKGNLVVPIESNSVYQEENGVIIKFNSTGESVYNNDGKPIVDNINGYVQILNNFIVVKNDERKSIYLKDGEVINHQLSENEYIEEQDDLLLINDSSYSNDINNSCYYNIKGEKIDFNK